MKKQSTSKLKKKEGIPYKKCLNCGTGLQGLYCHKCGQQATTPTPKVSEFIFEYMNNAFIWDRNFFSTIWQLIRRPGFLTNEFNSGKFVAYEHPLKLNMFFLFVFVTLFFLFSDVQIQSASDAFDDMTKHEIVRPNLFLATLRTDADYLTKMKESKRDTLQLALHWSAVQEFPEFITPISTITNHKGEKLDTFLVSIPQILVQDKVIVGNDSGVYCFAEKNAIVDRTLALDFWSSLWRKLLEILTQYFPMIFLLTSPLLAFAIKLLHLKRRKPTITYFIFALHYTAFIELMLLIVYLLYLTIDPDMQILQWIMILSSCLYLTIAVRNVYEKSSWIKSLVKAFCISLVYSLICFAALLTIFIISLCVVLQTHTFAFE